MSVVTSAVAAGSPPPIIYTIGHSTRTLDAFVIILRTFGIDRLIDVRTIPRSRHNPQFNKEILANALRNRRIGYRHLPELGGLRRPRPDSVNSGWRNASFRGFADYMQTPQFLSAIDRLLLLAAEKTTAIMCAEAVPWRCHRSLIGDALLVRGANVREIIGPRSVRPHTLTPLAVVEGLVITYPEQTATPVTGSESAERGPGGRPRGERHRKDERSPAPAEAERRSGGHDSHK